MLAEYKLPNIRKIFVPDPGYIIFDADLAGADALVVAAEAEDKVLLNAALTGYDIHSENATFMLGQAFTSLQGAERKAVRQKFKSGVHGTHYGGKPPTLSVTLGYSRDFWSRFQTYWFGLHPGVKTWHMRVERCLATNRTIQNAFGYRIIFYDRIDSVFPEALAWGPQSTVAETCFRGALQLKDRCPWIELLLQVHDSIVFQVPSHRSDCIPQIRAALPVPVPYRDPLHIPWGLSSSPVSWGDCQKVPA